MIKRALIGLAIVTLTLAGVTPAFADGNGNDGCHLPGLEEGHDKSDQHKLDMCYHEFEEYLAQTELIYSKKNNKTYHIYENEGDKHQIEVVHLIKECEEIPPIEDGSEEDNYLRPDLPVGDGTEEDNIEVEPPILEGEDDYLRPDLPAIEDENIQIPPVIEEEERKDDEVVLPDHPVEELPQTGGVSSFATIITALGSILSGVVMLKK